MKYQSTSSCCRGDSTCAGPAASWCSWWHPELRVVKDRGMRRVRRARLRQEGVFPGWRMSYKTGEVHQKSECYKITTWRVFCCICMAFMCSLHLLKERWITAPVANLLKTLIKSNPLLRFELTSNANEPVVNLYMKAEKERHPMAISGAAVNSGYSRKNRQHIKRPFFSKILWAICFSHMHVQS